MPEARITQLSLIHEMGQEEIHVKDGKIKVPDGPGLGITLVEDILKANKEDGEPYWG